MVDKRCTLGDYVTLMVRGVLQVWFVLPFKTTTLNQALTSLSHAARVVGENPLENPNLHIANFLQLYDTIKLNEATDDAIKLRLFHFSLRDKDKSWLQAQPQGSITTWDYLVKKFLIKHFPPSKLAKIRSDITSFC